MKKNLLFIGLAALSLAAHAQAPKLYINFVSHNEPYDNLHQLLPFTISKTKVLTFANLVQSKNARWNLETCDGFVEGALAHENAGTSSNDILEKLASPPYNTYIEIDPRNKNNFGRNIADLVHLLDSCGANPSNTLGGLVWFSDSTSQIDWFQYQDTIQANFYPTKWKAELMWGAGSLPPHTNDLNDYGVWKPDTTNAFYTHNPARTAWYIGNGCAPKLDSLEDEMALIQDLQMRVDSLQQGYFDHSKFYSYSITINQNQFGPMLFQKLTTVMDSINVLVTEGKVEWAKLTDKFAIFQSWQSNADQASQWACGQSQIPNSIVDIGEENQQISVFPNPFDSEITVVHPLENINEISIYNIYGQQILFDKPQQQSIRLSLASLPAGVYILATRCAGQQHLQKIIKE